MKIFTIQQCNIICSIHGAVILWLGVDEGCWWWRWYIEEYTFTYKDSQCILYATIPSLNITWIPIVRYVHLFLIDVDVGRYCIALPVGYRQRLFLCYFINLSKDGDQLTIFNWREMENVKRITEIYQEHHNTMGAT